MRVYGSKLSYFTGKLEAYLRYKEIPYEFVPLTPLRQRKVRAHVGVMQMPVVELPDGRWMTDTTPMIEWLERQQWSATDDFATGSVHAEAMPAQCSEPVERALSQ